MLKQLLTVIGNRGKSIFIRCMTYQILLRQKVRTIVQKVYGGKDVEFSSKAKKQLIDFEKFGWSNLPVCMAKSQYSLSDDPY